MNWDWQFTFEVVLPRLLPVVPVTIQATVLSFLLAVVLGLFLMLLRISRFKSIAVPAGELIELIRGTPLLVQLFFLFFLLPEVGITLPPLTTGILGIGIYNAGAVRRGLPGRHPGGSRRAVGGGEGAQPRRLPDLAGHHHSPVAAADRPARSGITSSASSRKRRCSPSWRWES